MWGYASALSAASSTAFSMPSLSLFYTYPVLAYALAASTPALVTYATDTSKGSGIGYTTGYGYEYLTPEQI